MGGVLIWDKVWSPLRDDFFQHLADFHDLISPNQVDLLMGILMILTLFIRLAGVTWVCSNIWTSSFS